MIKVEVLEDFTLKDFGELKNIERGTSKKEEGKLFKYDKFECSKDMCEYLTGKNPLNRAVVKVIEVEPEKEQWAVTKEEDGNVHVRPVVNDEIIDTPVERIIKPKSSKNKKSSKK